MQTSQSTLFYLCCASFLAGLLLAIFYDLLYMMRLWLLPNEKRYTVATIQRLCALRAKKGSGKRQIGFRIALFCGDVLFCIVGAVTLILLLYWLNDGAFRAAAPLCMALGFALWYLCLSRLSRMALQWVAFGVETVIDTLLLPVKRLVAVIVKISVQNAQQQKQKRLARHRQAYTRQALQHIERAVGALLFTNTNLNMQKGEGRARKGKKAV